MQILMERFVERKDLDQSVGLRADVCLHQRPCPVLQHTVDYQNHLHRYNPHVS